MNGFERLKEMETKTNNPFISNVVEYLIGRTELEEKYMNEEKSLDELVEYIELKALKLCKDDKKKMSNGRGKYSTVVVDNNQVYMWAVLYFTLSNEKLKLDELRKMAKESKVSNITKNKTENKPKKVSKKETQKEQISLFN